LTKSDHPLVATLTGQVVVVPGSSPLKILGAGPPPKPGEPAPKVNPGVVDYPFLQTAPTSRSVTNNSGGKLVPDRATDLPGPLAVGIAASERAEVSGGTPKPKMVVLGSGLMATNPFYSSNADLLMNAVQWLRGKAEESSGISPRAQQPLVFTADPNLR